MRPEILDNEEYCQLLKRILAREEKEEETKAADLMEKKTDYVERRNITRKMKKLKGLGIINIEWLRRRKNPQVYENLYTVNYSGLAVNFAKMLHRKYRWIGIGKNNWNLTMAPFSEKEAKKFEKYVKHYMKEKKVLEHETIRQMFYQMMITSYQMAINPNWSDDFDKIHEIIKNSMAADRFDQISKEVPIRIKAVVQRKN